MGKLIYNSSTREIEIDDRTLAHLRVAILNKLRRSVEVEATPEVMGQVRKVQHLVDVQEGNAK